MLPRLRVGRPRGCGAGEDIGSFPQDADVECAAREWPLERPPRAVPDATSATPGLREVCMVQFSFRPPSADYLGFEATPEGIIETACKAEELGFDAVLLNDHIIVDGSPRALPAWGNTYDPLMALSYVAARTTRIRIGTSVLIMPYRNPVATAKMMATLDQLSRGRVIAGVR